ncbi:MAG TPA: hypothetical protein VFP10_12600, partial [Candidatus Eisenbacteria bacterium]|nr:hypothetical protein [Candidatus Eisenbacteria bacterium]
MRISTLRGVLACALVMALLAPTALDAERAIFRATSRTLSFFALPGESMEFDLATYAGIPSRALAQVVIVTESLTVTLEKGRYRVLAPREPG